MHSFEELNAKINRLKREGGVGWGEPGKVLTWDGDTSKQVMLNDVSVVKVHDKCMDLANVKSLTVASELIPSANGAVITSESFFATQDPELGGQILVSPDDLLGSNNAGFPLLLSVPAEATGDLGELGASEGVYIVVIEALGRIAEIHFAETIHPIDPKYLPSGGGAVVVDLTKYKATNGYTFNDLGLSALQTSLSNGGTLATMEVTDVDGALRKAFTTDRQVMAAISLDSDGHVVMTKVPMSIATAVGLERAAVASGYAVVVLNKMPYEIKVQLSFYNNSDDTIIRCKAAPLT